MEQLFITDIQINKLRHLENINIPISKTERKHLIITGKNGSGKTSLLEQLDYFITKLNFETNSSFNKNIYYQHKDKLDKLNKVEHAVLIHSVGNLLKAYPEINVSKFTGVDLSKDFVYAYFKSTRNIKQNDNKIIQPEGPKKVDLVQIKSQNKEKINKYFLQYLVNLDTDSLRAIRDKDQAKQDAIKIWFDNFGDMLRKIFNDSTLQLTADEKNYTFYFTSANRDPFGFNELSDGYSAVIDILTELILKVEAGESKSYAVQGIVLIDEVETHLHLELQQNILPLLTSFFPNIQFIVTTHSPVVLASLENAVIYDLENKICTEDYSELSYGAVAKSYFNVEQQNVNKLYEELQEFKQLVEIRDTLDKDQKFRLFDLDSKFRRLGPLFTPEVFNEYLVASKRLVEC